MLQNLESYVKIKGGLKYGNKRQLKNLVMCNHGYRNNMPL